jgi:hypothetical protein
MNARIFDATNVVGLGCIGGGLDIIYGLGVALTAFGAIAIALNLVNASMARTRQR